MHVDDGLYGGNEFFEEKLNMLEANYQFGSKQCSHFTFTGMEVSQKSRPKHCNVPSQVRRKKKSHKHGS